MAMASKQFFRFGGAALRRSSRVPVHSQTCFAAVRVSVGGISRTSGASTIRNRDFHSSMGLRGIMPDTDQPAPRNSDASEQPTVPTDISTSEYNQRADEFLDELCSRLEAEQEKRADVEVEFSAGVLEVSIQSKGTYVLNKQPNKQIWLSSPVSGPKRFDWVVTGEGLHQKEGGGTGDWIYLRDGTSLTELVRKELGVELGLAGDAPK